ncbi:MAG TPA: alpha/beta hydrolase, partial [Candidatus Sulfomarinibacteraceae bacterium]|nr:alpha/beta hydrolase [Candidatus Sulfomarinibacteraceae bacterium]
MTAQKEFEKTDLLDSASSTVGTLRRSDTRVAAARQAERRLFQHYDLEVEPRFVTLRSGRNVRVLESGHGTPLVLVPGGVGDGWMWAPLMAQLRDYRLLVVNRPGGGLSDGIDHRQVDMRQLAIEVLTAVMDHFRLERAPIICNSMGGLWSFWFALAHPQRVSALLQFGCPALLLGTSAPLFMRLQSVPLLNRLLVKAMIPDSAEAARRLPTFLGHEERVGANWPQPMADCGYHFSHLPTYKTAWLSLMESVLTLRGAAQRYALGADELRHVQLPELYAWGDSD